MVEALTDTIGNKDREHAGPAVADIAWGRAGAMAGCAMTGWSVIIVESGSRGRISSLAAGVMLLMLPLLRQERAAGSWKHGAVPAVMGRA